MSDGGSSPVVGGPAAGAEQLGSSRAEAVDLEAGSPVQARSSRVLPTEPAQGSLQAAAEAAPKQSAAQAGPTGSADTKSTAKRRDYVLDNAKFFLTMCVVGTHTLGVFVGIRTFSTWFHQAAFVYMMPTYVFISGYCSSPDLSQVRKVDGIIKVAAIYLLAQLLWLALTIWAGPLWETTFYGRVISANGESYVQDDQPGGMRWKAEDWVNPYWHLWYLLDLVFWRLMLPFWWRLRYPLASAWVFCAVFVAFKVNPAYGSNTWTLDVDMILGWFPLFCLGAVAKERQWQLWESRWSRPVGLAVLLLFAWIPIVTSRPGDDDVTRGANGEIWHYGGNLDLLNDVTGDGLGGRCLKCLVRLAVPVAQALCVCATLHVAPRREWPVITSFGTRSLANYILHPLSGMLFSYLGCYGPWVGDWEMQQAPAWGELAIVACIVPTSLFWMSPWVWRALWPLFDPPIQWLLRPAGGGAAQAGAKKAPGA